MAADPPDPDIRLELDPPLARLVLARPAQRNAMSVSMLRRATAAVEQVGADDRIRALVVSGEGPDFCAGEDVRGFDFPDEATARDFLSAPFDCFAALEAMTKPVFVAVHGHALGFGAEILLVADGVVAAPEAVIGFAEIDHGVIPAVLLSRGLASIRRRRASWLALTGARISAAAAMEHGLVHAVDADPIAAAEALARIAAGWSPAAVRLVETLMAEDVGADYERATDFMPPVLANMPPVGVHP